MGNKKARKFSLFTFHFSHLTSGRGFTILELLIVLSLVSLIVGIGGVFLAGTLPSSRLNATAREISATVRHARALAQMNREAQVITLDMDVGAYGIEGRGARTLPAGLKMKVTDPFSGDIFNGKYRFVVQTTGSVNGGTIVLWNDKKTVSIRMDPVVGSVVIK